MAPEVASLRRDLEQSQALVHELLDQVKQRDRRIEALEKAVNQLSRKLFGPKAEKVHPGQLELIDLEALGIEKPDESEMEPEAEQEASQPRRKARRKRPPQELERQVRHHTVPDAERHCGCGRTKTKISERTSERLEFVPSQLFVIQDVQEVLACDRCDEEAPIVAPKPPVIIEKGKAGPGLLAHVVVNKYGDHLPLYRQQDILARLGVDIARSTLSGWLAQLSDVLEPVIDVMREDVLRSKIIHTDDTSVPVLDPGTGATRNGRLWVYIGDHDHRSVVFEYTPTRERDGPAAWLSEYEGYLQADAYPGYDGLFKSGRVVEVGCWAHARRYFYEASQQDPATPCQALAMIRQLFLVERTAKKEGLDAEARRALRQEKAIPILDAFAAWMEERTSDTLPKSPLGTALTYTRNQWEALKRYTDDGDLSIDNNLSERQLRPVAIGRKNWLFAGSDAAGSRAARFYSLVSTCKLHGIDPFIYLRDLFQTLPATPAEEVHDLTPLAWAAKKNS